MVTATSSVIESGSLYSVQGKKNTTFEKKHGALSLLSFDLAGNFSGKIAGSKQQLVMDIRYATNLTIDGRKVKLDLPEGAEQARYIVSYNKHQSGRLDVNVKMDVQDRHDPSAIKRIKFQPLTMDVGQEKAASLVADTEKLANNESKVHGADYVQYKLNKGTLENHGEHINDYSAWEASVKSLPAKCLSAAYDREVYARETYGTDATGEAVVAKEIDQTKNTALQGLSMALNWSDVFDVTDTIATLHNKPTYTKDVDTYADQLIKPKYASILKNAGLNPDTLKDHVKLLARLPVLGEADIPVSVMRFKGKLSDEHKRRYIFPINNKTANIIDEKLSHLPDSALISQVIRSKNSPLGSAGLILRSIAAMDQPRPWRATLQHKGCDSTGKYEPQALIKELLEEAQQRGYDQAVTQAFVAIFKQEQSLC